MQEVSAGTICRFWFEEVDSALWFARNDWLDGQIRERFSGVHEAAARGELYHWRGDAHGRLAEIIVLDQFSRNLFRDDARAFACDGMAVVLVQEALHGGFDKDLAAPEKSFLYMPLMHSESLLIHDLAMRCFARPGLEANLRYEQQHREIIERFGRYPHRNAVLGRHSSSAEEAFLKEFGSSF